MPSGPGAQGAPRPTTVTGTTSNQPPVRAPTNMNARPITDQSAQQPRMTMPQSAMPGRIQQQQAPGMPQGARPGYKAYPNQMPQQQAGQAIVVAGQYALTASMLAAAPPQEQKQMLGERLCPLIQRMHPELADKITGMLLEIDNSELLHMLESTESLKAKTEEVVAVLQAQQAKENAASQQPRMTMTQSAMPGRIQQQQAPGMPQGARPGYKAYPNQMPQQQAGQAIVVAGRDALTASMLAAAQPQEQKQMLGERLCPLIQRMHPELAGKITGMLLEIDNSELLHMLESTESLKAKTEEVVAVLQAQQAKENAASQQPRMTMTQSAMPGRIQQQQAPGMPQGARPGYKAYPNQMPQQQAGQAIVVAGRDALTASMLAAAQPQEQKQMLGERLCPLVQRMYPELAGKITGMLLEIDNSELLHMLESTESFKAKVEEAVAVLQAQQAKENAASQQPRMTMPQSAMPGRIQQQQAPGMPQGARPGYKAYPNQMPQLQAGQAIVVAGQGALTASMLAAAPPQKQKQMLGERLFRHIRRMHPELAGKITGMLLEIDNSELLHMLESTESLKAKVEEAVAVLQAHQAKENAATQSARAAMWKD